VRLEPFQNGKVGGGRGEEEEEEEEVAIEVIPP
jgi:hypothetical protein